MSEVRIKVSGIEGPGNDRIAVQNLLIATAVREKSFPIFGDVHVDLERHRSIPGALAGQKPEVVANDGVAPRTVGSRKRYKREDILGERAQPVAGNYVAREGRAAWLPPHDRRGGGIEDL